MRVLCVLCVWVCVCCCVGVSCCVRVCCVFCAWCVCPPGLHPQDPPPPDLPPPDHPKFRAFLSLSRHPFFALFGRGFTRQPKGPNVHVWGSQPSKTPPEFHEKTPQREKKKAKMRAGEGERKARIVGPPTCPTPLGFGPPLLSTPHPSGPPHLRTLTPLRVENWPEPNLTLVEFA